MSAFVDEAPEYFPVQQVESIVGLFDGGFFYEKKCLVWPLVFISSGPIDLFSALIVFETWKKWAYFPLKKIIFENKNQSKRPKELYVIVNKISYPIYLKR